jgi:hypothetical protein
MVKQTNNKKPKNASKKDQKKEDLEKEVQDIDDNNAYMVCLRKSANVKAIEDAWKKNDFCAIQKILEGCNVPPDKMKTVMIKILDCKDNSPQLWA